MTEHRDPGVELRPIAGLPVAVVRIRGRTRLNVLGEAALEPLADTLRNLRDRCAFVDAPSGGAESRPRAVVLTGTGDAFAGGADLARLAVLDRGSARAFITAVHEVCAAVRRLPVPAVALVRGPCLGAGMEIAAACDVRLADDDAVFGMPEVRVGVPSVVEAALLPRLIGWARTRELLLFGDTIDAARAEAWGFLTRRAAPGALDDVLGEVLGALARTGPRAVALQKALLARWETLPLEGSIDAGIDAFVRAYETDEPRRLATAFFEARGHAVPEVDGGAGGL